MNGFILLHKRLLNWEWYSDLNVSRVFIHSLLIANYQAEEWRGIVIQRGQFVRSRKNLASEVGLSEQQLRTALKKLESTNELTSSGSSQHTVFTVVKYDEYQPSNQQDNQESTSEDSNQQTHSKTTSKTTSPATSDQPAKAPENTGANGGLGGTSNQQDNQPSNHESTSNPTTNELINKNNNKNIDTPAPKKKAKRKAKPVLELLPRDIQLSDHWRALAVNYWAKHNRPDIDVEQQFFKFVSFHMAKATESANWQSNWQTWYVNAVEYAKSRGANHANSQPANQQSGSQQPAEPWFDESDISEINELYASSGG